MKNYYYITPDGQSAGPVPGETLPNYGVTINTMVWCEGMADWTQAGNVPELRPLFVAPPQTPYDRQYQQPYQQPYQQQPPYNQKPNNYLVFSILVTLFCCLIGGIVAIVYSSRVDGKWMQGDFVGAYKDAQSAKNWCIWSVVIGVICNGLAAIAYIGMLGAIL